MEMKREKLIISRKAQVALKEIFEFVKKEATPQVAKKVKDTIIVKCKSLKDFARYSKERYLSNDTII